MQLKVKSEQSEKGDVRMYIMRSTLQKIKAQAPQLGFKSMASYLEALSNLPARKIKSILN